MTRFDQKYYLEINEARWEAAKNIIAGLSGLASCIDAGCGPGWFSQYLSGMGLKVAGFDGREENLVMARARVPHVTFSIQDAENASAMSKLEPADLVFCFGLIYHLENPFLAIRNMQKLSRQWMLVETQILPGEESCLRLISEGENETQGLNFHATIPSRTALVKMLYVAGFSSVERFTGRINHEDFIDTPEKIHRREVFLAGYGPSGLPDFVSEAQPVTDKIDYSRK